jgi:hypothetical protein
LYNYFDFSVDEIKQINSFSIPIYKDYELSRDGKTLLDGYPIPTITSKNAEDTEI